MRFVAKKKGEVRAEGGLGLIADRSIDEVESADVVLVPGGIGNRPMLADEEILSWLRAIDKTTKWTTSVCTGSLVLGAAGLLEGKRATGNWLVLDPLRDYGADPVGGRFVEDGKVITAAGVTAGIDMALHLVAPGGRSRDRPGGPARDRVRPRPAVRLRLTGEGAARDRRAGQVFRRRERPDAGLERGTSSSSDQGPSPAIGWVRPASQPACRSS